MAKLSVLYIDNVINEEPSEILRTSVRANLQNIVEEGTIEIESVNSNSNETSIKKELLVLVDNDCGLTVLPEDFDTLNNSFYYECNDEWITVIRNRNLLTLVIRNNYSNEDRSGIISIYHNVDKNNYILDSNGEIVEVRENTINLTILQKAHEYSVSIVGEHEVTLQSLPASKEELTFNVICVGGREDFKVRRVKKYHLVKIFEDETTAQEYLRQVAYDNAFQIENVVPDGDSKKTGFKIINYGNINCNYGERCISAANRVYPMDANKVEHCHTARGKRPLIVEDYYYEITVHHIDNIDETDTLTVRYSTGEAESISQSPEIQFIVNAPRPYVEKFLVKPDLTEGLLTNLSNKIETGDLEGINNLIPQLERLITLKQTSHNELIIDYGSISCSETTLTFGCEADTKTVTVETFPEDANVFIKHYSDFIKRCRLNGREVEITVKRNPYQIDRECIIYLTNAVYRDKVFRLTVKQEGQPDTTR